METRLPQEGFSWNFILENVTKYTEKFKSE